MSEDTVSSATDHPEQGTDTTAGEGWAVPPEMVDGYRDGFAGAPEPGDNRSHSYRHGWKTGDADRRGQPAWATPQEGRRAAQAAISLDYAPAKPEMKRQD